MLKSRLLRHFETSAGVLFGERAGPIFCLHSPVQVW